MGNKIGAKTSKNAKRLCVNSAITLLLFLIRKRCGTIFTSVDPRHAQRWTSAGTSFPRQGIDIEGNRGRDRGGVQERASNCHCIFGEIFKRSDL